jgi:hypothetical protein
MANINIFNITWQNIADNMLPWYWRDLEVFSPGVDNRFWLRDYVRSMMHSIEFITDNLFELSFNINKKVNRTGQFGVMEIFINDDFDATFRRIFLEDAGGITNFNYDFYLQGETDPTPQSFYKQGEVDPSPKTFWLAIEGAGEFDFFVMIPSAVSVDLARLRSVVNTYVNAGKLYDVIFF